MIKIEKAENIGHYKIIEKLASEILHEVYDPIITSEQTDYFLITFQSEEAISNQIKNENFCYFILSFENKNVGYIGIQELNEKLNLSKFYILKSFRGLKIGKTALAYVDEFANNKGLKKMELIVNQQNKNAIRIYQKKGFKIIDSLINSFPNGYTVEDYKMEKIFK